MVIDGKMASYLTDELRTLLVASWEVTSLKRPESPGLTGSGMQTLNRMRWGLPGMASG